MLGFDSFGFVTGMVVVFLAAMVRGYSGFGFSALIVTSLTLLLPPAEVVPIAILLEIAGSLGLLKQVWKEVAWRTTAWLLAGAGLGMPAGFALLVHLPAETMRVVIALLVLGASLLIWFGFRLRGASGVGRNVATGVASGLANGTAAVGGLPVVLLFISSARTAASTRATLIVYLLISDLYGAGLAWGNGLVTGLALERAGLFCLPLFLGQWLGHRRFLATAPETFRRFVLILLMALATAALARAALG